MRDSLAGRIGAILNQINRQELCEVRIVTGFREDTVTDGNPGSVTSVPTNTLRDMAAHIIDLEAENATLASEMLSLRSKWIPFEDARTHVLNAQRVTIDACAKLVDAFAAREDTSPGYRTSAEVAQDIARAIRSSPR